MTAVEDIVVTPGDVLRVGDFKILALPENAHILDTFIAYAKQDVARDLHGLPANAMVSEEEIRKLISYRACALAYLKERPESSFAIAGVQASYAGYPDFQALYTRTLNRILSQEREVVHLFPELP